ncbi:MAG: putative metal-dependent hydrolase [Luteitalea sp.]|nr:putative metal-dependent hydrolase [Luteitalea sp.]
MKDPRFPIGRFAMPGDMTPAFRNAYIEQIAQAPARLRDAVAGLADAQLDTPYRERGWTVRQLVHHVADSHMNAYVRFRLALTESEPTIKPYDQERWATLADAELPLDVSLQLLDAMHARWVHVMRTLDESAFKRAFLHPEDGRITLNEALARYAWHGQHHTAHVTALRKRMGW